MPQTQAPEPVIAAVRAYMTPLMPTKRRPHQSGARAQGWPELVLLIDTETTVDAIQRLRFGSYRLCQWINQGGTWQLDCKEEGLFYGDDLPKRRPADFRALQAYVRANRAETADPIASQLQLYSRREFVELVLWRAVAQGHALVCGFNLPFDLSRLAVHWADARPRDPGRRFARGFSLQLWNWRNPKSGQWEEHPFRPRLLIRHEDRKRARFTWGSCQGEDLVEGKGRTRRRYTGHFLDLKTLSFALTGKSHSLDSAAKAFHTAHQKTGGDYAGRITPEYVNYNRRDVLVSLELLEKLRGECELHPIDADPWQLRSPASLAKGYLRACGITPLRTRAKSVPDWVLGAGMEAYFGGRTECHIPRLSVPVVYTDFLSMYPTVQTLAHLSDWLTADSVHAEICTEDAVRVLKSISVAQCLAPSLWPQLRFLARVVPADDVLPLRAQYGDSDQFTIGINRVTSPEARWYTGFDLAASVLFTGRVPKIQKAVTLRAKGKATLQPVQLRGQVTLDPRTGNIFRTVVELRDQVKNDTTIPAPERERLRNVLKMFANSGSYGIFAELNPQDLRNGQKRDVRVIGGSERFTAQSEKPEEPGEYCFPPLAALVTGAARLLLALLERLVTDMGGTYAYCDTDSLATVATETGGFVPCPGGPEQDATGTVGIRALSWAQVHDIVQRLECLKPYGPGVTDTLLKIEEENFQNNRQVQLYAFGISAKRNCLFRETTEGLELVRASEHGLGHLLNPTDPEDADRGASEAPKWIEAVWRGMILASQGQAPPGPPTWFARPAVARHGFTSPALLRPVQRSQPERPYPDQVKPFNFALTCYVTQEGAPAGTDGATCHLVAPFERDARKWLNADWVDTSTGNSCRITTAIATSRRLARVKSVADVVAEYAAHPESKSAGPHGEATGATTAGLLQRRRVEPIFFYHIGKESNRYEEVEEGQVRGLEEVQEVFEHPRRGVWERVWLPRLKALPATLVAEEAGIAESLIHRYQKEAVRPSPRQMKRLLGALQRG